MKRHIIQQSASLIEALDRLNNLSGEMMTLLVTAPDGRMTGTLTDGDIRRALLRGLPLSAPASEAMRRDFRFISEGSDAVATSYSVATLICGHCFHYATAATSSPETARAARVADRSARMATM